MKLKNIKINNYKSFGESDNLLFVDKLNAVIGKNESGKSNLISVLADINMIGLTDIKYFDYKNRINNKNINIELEFETYDDDIQIYQFKGNCKIVLNEYNDYNILGDMSEFIGKNKKYLNIISEIEQLIATGLGINKPENIKMVEDMIDRIKSANKKLFVEPEYYHKLKTLFIDTKNDILKQLILLFDEAINFFENICTLFPNFVKIENAKLKSRYTKKEIENMIEYDELLMQLFKICKIDYNYLLKMLESTDTPTIRNYEKSINKNIEEHFTEKFNNYYSQERIKLILSIDRNELSIMIDTTETYLNYDERSDGLKWYINLVIQLLFKENEYITNNIILIDEPGVYLHPNAQKELLSFLANLVKKHNQIIYTTHSPFMLDVNSLNNLRTIIKDEKGFSHIYNKITTIPLKSKSTYDTITPIIYGMGLNLNYNIGPKADKLNLITEGISDYYYILGYFNSKEEKNIPHIIPRNRRR